MVKVLFYALKVGGWSTTHRGKPDLIITTGIAWLYRVIFNSQLGIIPAGLFFIEKEINDMRKEQIITTNNNQIHSFYEPEELVGNTLIAITNLPTRAMMGIE